MTRAAHEDREHRSCDCGQHTSQCGGSTHVALRIPDVYRETLEELGLLEGAPDCSG